MRSAVLLIIPMSLSTPVSAQIESSQEPVALFREANEDYRKSRYDEAAEAYEKLLHAGIESAQLHFNLGNAYYRLGKTGRAILAFERAHRLDPLDADIEHNLRLARLRTIDRIDPVPELFVISWLRAVDATVPVPVTRPAFLVSWATVFLSLIGLFLIRSAFIVRLARVGFFLSVVFAVLFGMLVAAQTFAFADERGAIIQSPTVTAKASPDEAAVDAFVIHEGLKVDLSDELDGWVRIVLPDGKVGWIPAGHVEEI